MCDQCAKACPDDLIALGGHREPGQKIKLSVLHEGGKEPVDLEMARAIIEVPSIMGDLRKADQPREWDFMIDKDSKIGYIRLLVFNENSVEDDAPRGRGAAVGRSGGPITLDIAMTAYFQPETTPVVPVVGAQ